MITQTQVMTGFVAYRATGNTMRKLGMPKYPRRGAKTEQVKHMGLVI